MPKDMKLIMESWRQNVLQEEEAGPTVGEFLTIYAKKEPKKWRTWLGGAAKLTAALAGGILVGTATGAATGGLGTAAGGVAGAVAASTVGEQVVSMIFDKIADVSTDIAKDMLSKLNTPDDERQGVDSYFDLDDKYEKLLQGLDTPLAKELQQKLFQYYKIKVKELTNQSEADPEIKNKPLSEFLEVTANEFFKKFIRDQEASGIGLNISSV